MNENTKVRLKKLLDVTDLSGEKVMIDFETGKYFLLKGAANEIWDILSKNINSPISISHIRQKLMEIYDVDANTCIDSIKELLSQMDKNGFVELS